MTPPAAPPRQFTAQQLAAQLVAQIADMLYRANEQAIGEPGIGRAIYTEEAHAAVTAFVAQAVAAERARCAQVARDMCDRYWSIDKNTLIDAAHAVCGNIADAIERRGEVPQPDTAGQLAERARIRLLVERITEQRRAASERAWQNGDVAAAERHREAVAACEEIARGIERGEG